MILSVKASACMASPVSCGLVPMHAALRRTPPSTRHAAAWRPCLYSRLGVYCTSSCTHSSSQLLLHICCKA